MYKSYFGKEIQSREKEILDIDKNFIYDENGYYYSIENRRGIVGYAYLKKENDDYILEKIFVKSEKRYSSYGKNLLFFITNKKLKGLKIVVKNWSDIEKFLLKYGFVLKNDLYIYDASKEREKRKKESRKIVITSIVWNIILAITKITFGFIGKSSALLADGFNSLSDVATSSGIYLGLHFSNIPEDDDHPFGHEKIESVIGIIMGIMMILTAFELGRSGVISLFKDEKKAVPSMITIIFAGFSSIVKYFMYRQKMRYGIESDNTALIADAKDSRNDVFSSLGVILGIVLSIYINPKFDTIIGILVSLLILKEGLHVIFETTDVILDRQDTELLDDIKEYIYENTDIENVHDMVMRKSGDKVFLQFHIRIPGETTVNRAHKISDDLEASIIQDFKNIKSVDIHLDCLMK